jgi:hypothetical protein
VLAIGMETLPKKYLVALHIIELYHNFPVIVSSKVKHKSKVSEAIILYIRVSAFPKSGL